MMRMVIQISMLRFKSSGDILLLSGPDEQGLNPNGSETGSAPRVEMEEIADTDDADTGSRRIRVIA
jgi:hypothetical protein